MGELLRLRADAEVELAADGRRSLLEGHVRAPLGVLGPGLSRAVELLADGVDEDSLRAGAMEAEGFAAIVKVGQLLARLERGGWLSRTVVSDGRPVLTVSPIGHDLGPAAPVPPGEPVVLSRFAYVRALDGELVLETPRRAIRAVLHDPGVLALLGRLVVPVPVPVPGAGERDGDGEVIGALVRAGLVVGAAEESSAVFEQWSFADLLFHQRSRIGRHVGGYGGSFRFAGRFAPLPAVREQWQPAIGLAVPSADGADPPLGAVLESRVSVRAHDDARPLTVAQLGEFLHRCARNRAVFADGHEEAVSRPYPAGGSLHELELYPLVHNVAGLEPGLYHYDPQGHTLGLVSPPSPHVKLLLEYGRRTAVMDTPPQVVVLVSARFGRMMWKYESMAYAATLKHVGVLYQTMYLVATAMGLAPCALGGGNADGFAAAAGTDPYVEASVGEFVLGSRLPG